MFKKFFNNYYHLLPRSIILNHQLKNERKSFSKNFIDGLPSFLRSNYIKHLNDKPFLKVYNLIKDFTLIDVLRLYELWYLIHQTKKLDKGVYLEVGVYKGGSSILMGSALNQFKIKSKLFLADTFDGVAKATIKDNKYIGGEHKFDDVNFVKDNLIKNNIFNFEILKGVFPDVNSNKIDDKIRFIHIDVDTYQSARDIVEWSYSKLVKNAYIVFDDYGFTGCKGITKLCEEYEKDSRFLFIHNINGHCILLKK